MAPERFRGEGDGRADVYALGLTLYELLTFRPAFDSADRLNLIEQIKSEDPPRPRALDARIPRDLETIVLKAIHKDPKDHCQSADALGEDLRRFVANEPIRARRVSAAERAWRWCRRNPVVAGLLSAVFVLLAVEAVVASVGYVREAASRAAAVAAEQEVRRAVVCGRRQPDAGGLAQRPARAVAAPAGGDRVVPRPGLRVVLLPAPPPPGAAHPHRPPWRGQLRILVAGREPPGDGEFGRYG
jgi:hypothetical protein